MSALLVLVLLAAGVSVRSLAYAALRGLYLSTAIVMTVAFSLGYWASAHGHVLVSSAS